MSDINFYEQSVRIQKDSTARSITAVQSVLATCTLAFFYVCLCDSTTQVCEEPWSYIPDGILPVFWRVVYWTSQFLTW